MCQNIENLQQAFLAQQNTQQAQEMKCYMKDQFDFLGIKKPQREKLARPYLAVWKKQDAKQICILIKQLHGLPYREYMYVGQALGVLSYKNFLMEDIQHICGLVLIKPWWDNTDGYNMIIKRWLKQYPDNIEKFVQNYYSRSSIWERRLSIICQLGLKEQTNEKMLDFTIDHNKHDHEFFIQKAIGWALREYSKTHMKKASDILNKHKAYLTPLAIREAQKYLVNFKSG